MALQKDVCVYLPTWRLHAYTGVDMTAVTRICYAFCWLEMDSTFALETYQYDPPPLISAAHAAGVKVQLSVRDRDGAVDIFLADNTKWAAFISAAVSEMTSKGYDGIDIDFEIMDGSVHKAHFTSFVHNFAVAIRAADADAIVSMAFGADTTSTDDTSNALLKYDLAALSVSDIDYVFLMGYDWFGDWGDGPRPSGPNAPWILGSDNPIWPTGAGNSNSLLNIIAAGVDRSKLILGVPWYAKTFIVDTDVKWGDKTTDTAVAMPGFREYINLINSSPPVGTPHWDTDWQTTYYSYDEGRVMNPGFEVNDYGWINTQVDLSTLGTETPTGFDAHNAVNYHGGSYSGKITGPSIDNHNRYYAQLIFGLAGDTTYDISAWAKAVSIASTYPWTGGAVLRLAFYNELAEGGWDYLGSIALYPNVYFRSAGTLVFTNGSKTVTGSGFRSLSPGIWSGSLVRLDADDQWVAVDSVIENYGIGTVTFTHGSTSVTGSAFDTITGLASGTLIKLNADGVWATVGSVASPTLLYLTTGYTGTGGTGAGSIQRQSDTQFTLVDNYPGAGGSGAGSYGAQTYLYGTQDWSEITGSFVTPTDTTVAEIQMGIENATGDIYWDDVVFDSGFGIVHKQMHYEDLFSLRIKYQHAIELGLGGVGTWDASLAGGATDDLWQQFKDIFGGLDDAYVDADMGDESRNGTSFGGGVPDGATDVFAYGYCRVNPGGTLHVASGDYSSQFKTRYNKSFKMSVEDPNTTGAKNVKIPESL